MDETPSPLPRRALWALFPLTVLTMLPVTGVVPVLKILVGDHYGVGPMATSLFMSINMVGALLAAPLLGAWSDRAGNTRSIPVVCALADATLWWMLSSWPPFALLLGLRLLEGAAHIGVLTMLMATMSHASVGPRRAARMAGMGGAIIFGVAVGAPLGGVLGRVEVVLPLRLGMGIMVCVALVGAVLLPVAWGRLRAPPALPWPRGVVGRAARSCALYGCRTCSVSWTALPWGSSSWVCDVRGASRLRPHARGIFHGRLHDDLHGPELSRRAPRRAGGVVAGFYCWAVGSTVWPMRRWLGPPGARSGVSWWPAGPCRP